MKNYKMIKYENNNGTTVDVRFDKENNTIWLTQSEIALLLNSTINAISKNIKKIEKDTPVIAFKANTDSVFSSHEITEIVGADGKTYKTKLYNLDMIEAISKRSKSNSGDEFIKWANDILKSNNNLSMAEFSPNEDIKSKIYQICGAQVMLDFELAELYGYNTKAFNQQVSNNIEKFDLDFMFQLTGEEWSIILRSKILTANLRKTRYLPYAFTEQGIYMNQKNKKNGLLEY